MSIILELLDAYENNTSIIIAKYFHFKMILNLFNG